MHAQGGQSKGRGSRRSPHAFWVSACPMLPARSFHTLPSAHFEIPLTLGFKWRLEILSKLPKALYTIGKGLNKEFSYQRSPSLNNRKKNGYVIFVQTVWLLISFCIHNSDWLKYGLPADWILMSVPLWEANSLSFLCTSVIVSLNMRFLWYSFVNIWAIILLITSIFELFWD